MKTSQKGIDLIKSFEGCKLNSYKCPAGIWTIGYGHTLGVRPCQSITLQDAEDFLAKDLKQFEDCVNLLVKVNLTQNEFDALVSFTYNLGCGSLRKSTMLKYLNVNNKDLVPMEILKWNKAGGKVLKGLVRRREDEAKLFTTICQAEAIDGKDFDKPNSKKAL